MPLSFSSIGGCNTVINSNNLMIVSRRAYVMRITHFFVNFARERSYNGYNPYHVNAGHVLRVLREVMSKGNRMRSLSGLRRLKGFVGSHSLYKLKGDTPLPMLSALEGFESRCMRRVISGGYTTRMYGTVHSCIVSPRGYGKYAGYTEGYPINTVANGGGRPRDVSASGYVGYKAYLRGYMFNTVSIGWKK